MRKDRTFSIKLLLGETWEETEKKILMAREFCNVKDENLVVNISYKDVTKFQLEHLRNGVVPYSSKLAYYADTIKFVDEDDSVRVLKNRNGKVGVEEIATVS